MSAELIPKPRGLTPAEARFVAALVTDPDLSETEALRRAGFSEAVAVHPGRIATAEMRAYIEDVRRRAIEATLQEAFIDASEVLRELIRQLARLTTQAQRIHADLGHDIGEIYSESGALKAVSEWPEVWRRRLVVEIESRESSERSHDGATKDKDGGWDLTGQIRKVKRESTAGLEKTLLAVEKEIRECLGDIGRHIEVAAFPQPKSPDLHLHLHADITAKLQGALQREVKLIDTTASEPDTDTP